MADGEYWMPSVALHWVGIRRAEPLEGDLAEQRPVVDVVEIEIEIEPGLEAPRSRRRREVRIIEPTDAEHEVDAAVHPGEQREALHANAVLVAAGRQLRPDLEAEGPRVLRIIAAVVEPDLRRHPQVVGGRVVEDRGLPSGWPAIEYVPSTSSSRFSRMTEIEFEVGQDEAVRVRAFDEAELEIELHRARVLELEIRGLELRMALRVRECVEQEQTCARANARTAYAR